jgi:hypothetical protein
MASVRHRGTPGRIARRLALVCLKLGWNEADAERLDGADGAGGRFPVEVLERELIFDDGFNEGK